MDFINTAWQMISGVIMSFRFTDFIDICIVAYLFYKCIQLVQETQAAQLVKGILLLLLAALAASVLHLKTLSLLLNNIFSWGLLAVIVLFQPELRRMLERVGRTKVRGKFNFFTTTTEQELLNKRWDRCIHIIANACESLSRTKTGALIVFERDTRLGEQIDTGVIIHADVSEELIGNLFFKNSPLHDGAVIIRDGSILAASCFLPKPRKEEFIARELGSRHRAAIGMSENSDALVLIVSEETGSISVAADGNLKRDLTKTALITYLKDGIIPKTAEEKKKKKHWRTK